MKLFKVALAVMALSFSVPSVAQVLLPQAEVNVASAQANLQRIYPRVPWGTPEPSAIEGWLIVPIIGSSETIYVSNNGEHLFTGKVFRISGNSPVDIAEERLMPERAEKLASYDLDEALIYPASSEKKARIYVFTDVSCGYCRRFHGQLDELNAAGVEVVYLAYPRDTRSRQPAAYRTMTGVWCSRDPKGSLNEAFDGESFQAANCSDAVRDQYNFGMSLGVNSTPHIFFEDGTTILGAQSTEVLLQQLGI
jgi:thiol:disulfide interchange protein DsbC